MNRYGLIGRSLGHSFSQSFFAEKFEREGIDASYDLFELPEIDELLPLVKGIPGLGGLNVTIPYKSAVIPFLDAVDPAAAEIGAVNTILVDKNGLKGFNTDYQAFRNSLAPFLAHGMEKALILGTGGAAKAVAYTFRQIGVKTYFVSRSPKHNDEMAYGDINQYVMKAFHIIVNATPIGTFPGVNDRPDLPYHLLTPSHMLYDLVYNPAKSAFLQAGEKQGSILVNGLTMLHLQADASWKIWQTGKM